MTAAPSERWRMATGADITFARSVRAADGDGLLVLAGSVLQRLAPDGTVRWRLGTLGASFVEHVGPFDGSGSPCALVKTDSRTLVLIDVATGEPCWQWAAEPGTFVGEGAGFVVEASARGTVLYLFPTYSRDGWCFDFTSGRRSPTLRWHVRDLPFDAGFGPSVVLADMDGDAELELLLSSRTGTEYRSNDRTGTTTTSELVLGRQHGEIWQAIVSRLDGRILHAAHFEAVPGAPHDSARPYGLLWAGPLDPGGLPVPVLVSCQVEEYAVLTRRTADGGLAWRDGWFVEKDWPIDDRELRPQPSSVADLRGDGRPLLVVGLWQDGRWRTLVMDPRVGLREPAATLHGRYFWGCHDVNGDGVAEIITSRERRRSPRSRSTLEAWDGRTMRRVAGLRDASVIASSNSPLPPNVAFMAIRRNAVDLALEGGPAGILVREGDSVGVWGAPPGGGRAAFHALAQGAFDRADTAGDAIVLADAAGRVQQLAFDTRPSGGPLRVHGRLATPLSWAPAGLAELVVDLAGNEVVGGRPVAGSRGTLDDRWSVPGTLPALDEGAGARLSVADASDPDEPALAIHAAPVGQASPRRVRLPAPVYLGIVPVPTPLGGYLVNLRTGVHTMAVEYRDRAGRRRWRDARKGAYLRPPAVDAPDGVLCILSDDHGELRRYGPRGDVAWLADWTAAYTLALPGPWGPTGAWAVLRGGGIHGLELLDADGATIWRTDTDLWEYASSTPAIGWLGGPPDAPVLGALTRGGRFDAVDVRTGALRWSLDVGAAANATSIVAADLDGDGADEFVLGLPDGRLVCLGEDGRGRGTFRWESRFDVAVGNPIVVDLDGDGLAELVVATADGQVRWLA